MSVSYNKLWKLLIDKKINKSKLQKLAGISGNVSARLSKEEYVSMESIEKICKFLNCEVVIY